MKRLKISGEVERPIEMTREEFGSIDASARVDDLSRLGVDKRGSAVKLRALVERAGPKATVRFVTFHAPRDDFYASAPLDRIIDEGYVIYGLDGAELPESNGGPFRFFIPNPAACKTDEIDECLNVKYLEEIILSSAKGRDTRPRDEAEHAKLHED